MTPTQRILRLALAAALLPAVALAAAPAHDHNHGASVPATAATSPEVNTDTVAPAPRDPTTSLLDRMRDLHERLGSARTAVERQKLLAENRRLLQEAMNLLDSATGPHGGKGMTKGSNEGEATDGDALSGRSRGKDMVDLGPQPRAAAPDGRKRMGDMDMQHCEELHASQARHMELMHAVLRALVDQQASPLPAK